MPETQILSPMAAQYKATWDAMLAKASAELQARVKASQSNNDWSDKEVVAFTQLVAEEAERVHDIKLLNLKKDALLAEKKELDKLAKAK